MFSAPSKRKDQKKKENYNVLTKSDICLTNDIQKLISKKIWKKVGYIEYLKQNLNPNSSLNSTNFRESTLC